MLSLKEGVDGTCSWSSITVQEQQEESVVSNDVVDGTWRTLFIWVEAVGEVVVELAR
jgi:hypothetical protein